MEARWAQRLCGLLLAVGICLQPGCFGVTQNPSYFPYLLPTGDIIQTHAKPIGPGYYANFDPHAARLELRPVESTDPVRTQHVLIATVYDEKGLPRRDRRVEWLIEGVGNIVEVDESGVFPGRGYKVDNKYAVSYTSYCEHRITRGTADPNDDFVIRPGQTWCVISSAVEGDSYVTAYAPEIFNWNAHKVFVTQHWVDAQWAFPPPAVERIGAEHALTTNFYHHTDHRPLAGYRVRYTVVDGPPGLFLPAHAPEAIAISDLNGNASVSLVQVTPRPGLNHIGIEVIRPPDPTTPSGSGITIGRGETTVEWRGALLSLDMTGPPVVSVGQEIPYTITITNGGQIESGPITLRDALPESLQFAHSEPRASIEGSQLIWTLGNLPPGGRHVVQLALRATHAGEVNNCVQMNTAEGIQDSKCVRTQVSAQQLAQLTLTMNDVPPPPVNTLVNYLITVANPGTGPATNVTLNAEFDAALEHQSHASTLTTVIGTLAPGESKAMPLTLTPRRAGQFPIRVVATADGNLRAQVEKTVSVQNARLLLSSTGPKAAYVDKTVTWTIIVANPGDLPLGNAVVRAQLPPEVAFQDASELGKQMSNEVVWTLGALIGRGQKTLNVTGRCLRPAGQTSLGVIATADPGLQEQVNTPLQILGVPAFLMQIAKVGDPVPVGGKVTYRISVSNTGSLAATQVELTTQVAPQLKVTSTDGPTRALINGNQVSFPAIESLQAKQTVIYTVEAQGMQPGDVRFRAELRSAALSGPVVKEESTTVFAPVNGNGLQPSPLK
jgi:uncharacterized repeat protein (TIGR01451 family)